MARNPYPTDLTDAEWRRLRPLIPPNASTGRPPKHAKREVLNAILYVTRSGRAWRSLPHDLPSFHIVYHWFRKWRADGTWERVHAKLRERVRNCAGGTPMPTAALLDSSSVKRAESGGLLA